ncbi:hypothetical protein GS399_02205 [Pedobacter sp. HMF7647]|uniref:ATP-grasp domain-containing protein n=1 Tax=Hufsiella arboris TaxID=2695275 RepID=A0A7K1Y5A5_9SPHI|nr:ATP-grasp fold amidoligase family protein [Hufsiella arboris]MXV49767.1 hypothetical protein [Hufsiella arboris]
MKQVVETLVNTLSRNSAYSKRIRHRYKTFWNNPDAEKIRNTQMDFQDPLHKWTDAVHWQRKLSNKYNAREFAKMHGCKVADLYWHGRNLDSLDFETLPDHYIIRPTIGHSCNSVYMMAHGFNLFDKKRHTPSEIKTSLKRELAANPFLEFMVEEFLINEAGRHEILNDYKFFTFNGNIAGVGVINRFSPTSGFQTAYTEDWKPTKRLVRVHDLGPTQPPPNCLDEMINAVKRLSKAYEIFVRIDFYATSKGAVFGEFSPTPLVGNCSSFYANKIFKAYWDKYCKGMIVWLLPVFELAMDCL